MQVEIVLRLMLPRGAALELRPYYDPCMSYHAWETLRVEDNDVFEQAVQAGHFGRWDSSTERLVPPRDPLIILVQCSLLEPHDTDVA